MNKLLKVFDFCANACRRYADYSILESARLGFRKSRVVLPLYITLACVVFIPFLVLMTAAALLAFLPLFLHRYFREVMEGWSDGE